MFCAHICLKGTARTCTVPLYLFPNNNTLQTFHLNMGSCSYISLTHEKWDTFLFLSDDGSFIKMF